MPLCPPDGLCIVVKLIGQSHLMVIRSHNGVPIKPPISGPTSKLLTSNQIIDESIEAHA